VNHTFVLSDWMQQRQTRVEQSLTQHLTTDSKEPTSTKLIDAMRYSTLNGGKRLRALFVYAAGEALGADLKLLDFPACAVEMIHAYSLVHDDMPAMDDDDLRRGKPTCHKAYGEATALLTGDALQSLAFETLCNSPLSAQQQINLIRTLANHSGVKGMAGGQAIDLESVGQGLSVDALQTMHQLKTGALIQASLQMGALASDSVTDSILDQLAEYGSCVGLAFQVHDDVLDVTSDTDTLGKTQGADIALNKPTYPALMGLAAAQQKAAELIDKSLAILEDLPYDTQALADLSQYIVQRRH
jgi:geranylgeranyl pyrophosphate synthase